MASASSTSTRARPAFFSRTQEPACRVSRPASCTSSRRSLVKQLAGILKIADGLDRTRVQKIEAVRVDAMGKNLVVTVEGCGDLSLDIRRAAEKSALLGEVFGRSLEIAQAV